MTQKGVVSAVFMLLRVSWGLWGDLMRTTICFLIVALGAGCRSGKLISIDTASSSVGGSGSDEEGQTTTDDTGAEPSDDTSSTGTDDTGATGTIDSGTPSTDDTGGDFSEEICDGIDNDGDGDIDEGFESDADGDGILDCIDIEECDGLDNDGDGLVDEDFTDTDRDGTADCLDAEECDGLDNDGDGLVDEGFDSDEDGLPDCFDSEICDGIDNDGDGEIDEAGAYGEYTWYRDADGDGVGVEEDAVEACDEPEGRTLAMGDCDDDDPAAYPGATEVCDGVDNDCDGRADEEEAEGSSTYYRDADGDGDGTSETTTISCDAPEGYVTNSDDCNDADSSISPASEDVCDGIDNDCDGGTDEDSADTDADGTVDCLDVEECDGLDNDGDGVIDEGFDFTGDGSADCTDDDGDGLSEADGDCDDSLDTVYPGAPEVDDGIDNDCDGEDLITVLFELSHGEATWSDPEAYDTYTGWGYAADIIEDMGAEWGRLDDAPITADSLAGWDVVIVAEPLWGFSDDELDVFYAYAEAGGGLLITTDYNEEAINPLASMFGAEITGTSSGYYMVSDLTEHPITEDVDGVYISNGSSLTITGDAEVIGRYEGLDLIAVSEVGAGGIVFVADNEVFSYYAISFADNDTFLERIITWLARD